MKKINFQFSTINIQRLLLLVAFLTGCSKEEESLFTGRDNAIAAFILTKDGATLHGAVSPDSIAVTVPEGVSLAGATASVTLSENAAIAPDPAAITDWDVPRSFTVTAYNGTPHTYYYTVKTDRRPRTFEGNIVLFSQADVESFAATFDANRIYGNITIGAATGADSVYALAGLERIKTVTGSITIELTYAGDELTAFADLEAAGELRITSKRVKTVRFPKLAAVHADLHLDQASSIRTIDFPELALVEKNLRIYYADSLLQMHFPKLQVVENLTLQGRSAGTQNLRAVELPELTEVTGTLNISYLNATTSFAAPRLATAGALTISSCAAMTSLDFGALTTVNGGIDIQALNITSLDGFGALESIGGRLYCYNTAKLASLAGMASLRSAGTYYLYGCTALTQFDVRGVQTASIDLYNSTMTGLTITGDTDFAGRLYFGALPSGTAAFPVTVQGIENVGELHVATSYITTLTLPWVKTVSRRLTLSCGSVTAISLPNLRTVGGVTVSSCAALTTLSIPDLTAVTGYTDASGATAGSFTYTVSSNITKVELPKLQSIAGSLSITGLTATRPLATIRFPVLESISGTLTIAGTNNAVFKDLSGFTALTSAAGVTIGNFTQLRNFCPLQGVIHSLNDNTWKISGCGYSPTYQNMLDEECSN
ncbi:MAG: hypothetical protein LBS12_07035 [Prevotellaceae bacterium]|nr:hypothetical protein [Prevotellaceae bacterium]